jgi:hypothetical protein
MAGLVAMRKVGGFVMKGGIKNYSDNDQVEFLRAAQKWPALKGEWAAKQILGAGENGIVLKFECTGSDPRVPKFMVVKQSHEEEKNELQLESRHLQRIAATGTEHVVRLYRTVRGVPGSGTSTQFDPHPDDGYQMYRIYLEFCGAGDSEKYRENKLKQGRELGTPGRCIIPEEHLWRILHCIARGLLVLEQGSEDPDDPDTDE